MPDARAAQRSPRGSIWGLWILLTVAAVGFSLLLVGLYADVLLLQQTGIATLAFGAVSYLFVHFFLTATGPLAHARPVARVAPARAPRENFEHLLDHTLERVPPPEPDLVLFEPVERAQPTAAAAAAAAPDVVLDPAALASWPAPVEDAPQEVPKAESQYHANLLQRRTQFLQGLPLVEQILEAPPPGRDGKTLGACSGCGARLWAPTRRPIRLRCPRCGRVRTLT